VVAKINCGTTQSILILRQCTALAVTLNSFFRSLSPNEVEYTLQLSWDEYMYFGWVSVCAASGLFAVQQCAMARRLIPLPAGQKQIQAKWIQFQMTTS
jgi:hypothetical protein